MPVKTLLVLPLAALLLAGCQKSDPAPQTYAVQVNYTITDVDSPYSADVVAEADMSQGATGYEHYRHQGITTTGTYTDSDEFTAANKSGRTLTFTVAISYAGGSATPPPLPATALVKAEVVVDGAVRKSLVVTANSVPDGAGRRQATYSLPL